MDVFFQSVIIIMAIFLFGTLGEIFTEKSGNLNLGTPGIICLGGAGCITFLNMYANMVGSQQNTIGFLCVLLAIIGAALFATMGALIYSFFCTTLKSNQNVVGLCLTTFGVGVLELVKANNPKSLQFISARDFCVFLPGDWVTNTGWFGKVFLEQGLFIYIAIILAFVLGWFFRRTKLGLNIRAVGENPGTADAVGINVTKTKYLSTIVGSIIASFGGIVYVMIQCNGKAGIGLEAFGWIAVALVISSLWTGELALLTSFCFALLYCSPQQFKLGGDTPAVELFNALPYFITLVLLILTSFLQKKELQGPESLGITYFREDR